MRRGSGRCSCFSAVGGVPVHRRQYPQFTYGSGDNRTVAEIPRRQEMIMPGGLHQRAWSCGGLSWRQANERLSKSLWKAEAAAGSGDNRTMAEISNQHEWTTPAGRHQRAWSDGGLSCERRLHRCEQGPTDGDNPTIVHLLYETDRLVA